MKVYNNPIAGSGFKVTALIHELELKPEIITVDLGKRQQYEPWYLAINPTAKVPALVDGELVLWESNAIVTYLASLKPERGLLPTDPRGLAEVQKWLHWQSCYFYNDLFGVTWNTYYHKLLGHPQDEKALTESRKLLARDLKLLEDGLAGREYLTGKLSVADFALASILIQRESAGIDLKPYPQVKAWVERMDARPSMQKARPPVMMPG